MRGRVPAEMKSAIHHRRELGQRTGRSPATQRGEASAGAQCEKKDVVRTVGSALTERACKCWGENAAVVSFTASLGELPPAMFLVSVESSGGESKIGDRAAL